MNKNVLSENINKVEEMVLDEDKLVTYISLSKELCLHVNESKLLLYETIKHIKKKQPDTEVKVSYILSGISEGNFAHTLVCNEKEVVNLRKNFFKIIFFDHVYSISKSVSEVDKVAYLAINKLEDFSLCAGLIKNTECVRHTFDEIDKLKSRSQSFESVEQNPVKKNILENKNCITSKDKPEVNKPVTEIKNESSPKKDISIKPKFQEKKTNPSQKRIAGFFAKTNGTNKMSLESKDFSAKPTLNEVKIEKTEMVKLEKKSEKIYEHNENVNTNDLSVNGDSKNDSSKSKTNKVNSLSNIKKNAKVDTKRKRVLHVSDSESEDDKNDPFQIESVTNNDSDDEIPPTPAMNTVKITSGFVNPKKRRKIIDKTYTDEEGYILTKKVEVYESCSENEEETPKENVKLPKKPEVSPEVKKNATKTKKKISPPQKGKQSTLMNFFKKT